MKLDNAKTLLLRKWKGFNHREQVLVTSLGGLVGLIGIYFLLINPLVVQTVRKQVELSELKQQVALAQQQISTFEKNVTQNIQSLQSAQLIKTRTQNALPLFLDHIGHQQQQLGFTVLSISMPNTLQPEKSPSPSLQAAQPLPLPSTSPASSFKKILIEVSLLATYQQMGQFLESLESLPILVNVSELTIQRQDIEQPHSIKVVFQVISRSAS